MTIVWAMLEKGFPFALSFLFSIALARLVSPESYGLIAMTTIFMAVGLALQNLGLGAALIQTEQPSDNDTTTVFLMNIFMSVAIGTILALCAPAIAAFFDRSDLVPIVYANAAVLVITGFGIIQMTMLQRRMQYRTGFVVDSCATLVAGTIALGAAFQGYDVWALVALSFTRQICSTSLLWILVRWRPLGRFDIKSLKRLWAFSAHMVTASLFHHIAANLTNVLIGKGYSASDLGLFTRAQSLQALPVGLIASPIQRVAFPSYSRQQSDRTALREALRSHQRLLSLLAAFVAACLTVGARELVLILVGETWEPSAAMLRILAPAAFFMVLFPLHSEANKAIGESYWFMRIELAKKFVLLTLIIAGFYFGLKGVLIALVLASVSDYILSATSSARFLGYGWLQQLRDLLPAALCGAVAVVLLPLLTPEFAAFGLFGALIFKVGSISCIFLIAIFLLGDIAFPEAKLGLRSIAMRFRPGTVQ